MCDKGKEYNIKNTTLLIGVAFGTVVTMPITGFISASWIGWPPTFYLFGGLGYGWALIWAFFGANGPDVHKSISVQERTYIETSLGVIEDTHVRTVASDDCF